MIESRPANGNDVICAKGHLQFSCIIAICFCIISGDMLFMRSSIIALRSSEVLALIIFRCMSHIAVMFIFIWSSADPGPLLVAPDA